MKKNKKVLFVYVSKSNTGLSGKAKKIEDGFVVAGAVLSTVVLNSAAKFFNKGGALGTYWAVFRLLFSNRFELAYIRYAYYLLPIYILCVLFSIPFQVDINGNVEAELLARGQKVRAVVNRCVMQFVFKFSSRIHVVSKELKSIYCDLYPRAEGKIVFTANFVVDEYYKEKVDRSSSDLVNLVFMGTTAQKWHGIDEFVVRVIGASEWVRENCHLHLVGECADTTKDIMQARDLDGCITAHGFLEGDKKYEVLSNMDVGICGFNLPLKGQTQTTHIKTGEYLFSGICLLLGYEDPIISKELSFVQSVDLMHDLNALDKVEKFLAYYKLNWKALSREAHEYACSHLMVSEYINNILAKDIS